MNRDAAQVDRLYTDIEWALAQGLPLSDLVPMIERLARQAEPGSAHAIYANRQLAELLVRSQPFRAARLAREVLSWQPDDRCYAVVGMSCMIMGHYALAEKAYRQALAMVPHCPWYAHNLGHLLDAALDRPAEGLKYLTLARKGLPHEPEIASSHAHALLRAGHPEEGLQALLEAVEGDEGRARAVLSRWGHDLQPSD